MALRKQTKQLLVRRVSVQGQPMLVVSTDWNQADFFRCLLTESGTPATLLLWCLQIVISGH